jgi:hypothetical protein
MTTPKSKIIQKIKYLQSLVSGIDDSDTPVSHQMTYLLNEIDYQQALLLQIEVEECFSDEEFYE